MKVRIITLMVAAVGMLAAGWMLDLSRKLLATGQPDLADTVWQFDYVILDGAPTYPFGDYPSISLPPKQIQVVTTPTIEIKGYDGCNSFRGPLRYSARDGSFEISIINQTAKGCIVQITTESWVKGIESNTVSEGLSFLEALGKSRGYELKDGELRLYSQDTAQILVFAQSGQDFRYRELPSPIAQP